MVPRPLEYALLRMLVGTAPRDRKPPPSVEEAVADGGSQMRSCLRDLPIEELAGSRILDFGCGAGWSTVWLGRNVPAGDVVGCDLQTDLWPPAAAVIAQEKLPVRFVSDVSGLPEASFDAVFSHDAFEHFLEPEAVLRAWHRVLRPGGRVFMKFGPLWGAPLGLHMFGSVSRRRIPWVHRTFREQTVMRLWSEMAGISPPLTTYAERGLNKMTPRRFHEVIERSGFELTTCTVFPVRRIWRFPATRLSKALLPVPVVNEFFANGIHCVLTR